MEREEVGSLVRRWLYSSGKDKESPCQAEYRCGLSGMYLRGEIRAVGDLLLELGEETAKVLLLSGTPLRALT